MRRLPSATLGVPGARVCLDPSASHHALHVLRLTRGTEVLLFDGKGHQQRSRLADVEDGTAIVEVLDAPARAAPAAPLHVVLGLVKGPAMDLAVRVVTEAGATHIHPALSHRSVPRGDRLDRWDRIARAAAQQCGRADVPTVHELADLDTILQDIPCDLDLRIALPGGPALARASGPAGVIVGPEGGWTDDEVRRCLTVGARPMGLGAWVFRADTAAAVATACTAPA